MNIKEYLEKYKWTTMFFKPCITCCFSCLTIDSASSHFSSTSISCGYTYQNGVPKKECIY